MAKKSMILKQQAPAKFSTRKYNRCKLCGRPHAYLRDYGVSSAVCLPRRLALQGLTIPAIPQGFLVKLFPPYFVEAPCCTQSTAASLRLVWRKNSNLCPHTSLKLLAVHKVQRRLNASSENKIRIFPPYFVGPARHTQSTSSLRLVWRKNPINKCLRALRALWQYRMAKGHW